MTVNPDSLIHLLDSIRTVNQQLQEKTSFWYDFKLFDTNVLIVIVTVSSIIITTLIQFLLHRSTFKDEYYKQIIEKRLSSYSNAEHIVAILRKQRYNNGRPFSHTLFENWDTYEEFYKLLLEIDTWGYWLNNETDQKLIAIEELLRNHIMPLVIAKPDDLAPDIVEIGKELYIELELLASQLQYLIFKDLKNLHRIQKFIKSKTPYKHILAMTKEEFQEYLNSFYGSK